MIRSFDWSKTSVGEVQSWPQSLKTAVRIILNSGYPMFIWWGQDLINLYNDPYRAFLGAKHPGALGKPAPEAWGEIWDEIGPRKDAVLLRGESTFDDGLLLVMDRHGYQEETYFTFSYSPLHDDEGRVAGLFCAVAEVTEQVIGQRRLALLRDISAAITECRTPSQVCRSAAQALSREQRDLPFTLIYLLDGNDLKKAGSSGIAADHAAAPAIISLADSGESPWPVRQVMETGEPVLMENVSSILENLPRGEWSKPPECAVLLPIARQGQGRPAGVFVAGLNPYRKFDDEFRGFVALLSNQIASAIANAVAYEAERERAESLAEIDRAKTLFFSNISHEFRTPLTLMMGPLEDALSHPEHLPEPERERLELAHRNAVRLLKLVNTLLDFSRIEAGRMQAMYEPTELGQLTAELASAFCSAIERGGMRYIVDCPALPEMAYVDREMWEKIVLNLLSNAFKFTFAGEIEISLRQVVDHKKPGLGVELTVRDTGTGIPADEIPRLFERFHRVKGARGRSYEGSGIGLALVQELVKLHGGSVRVESEVDRGSRFIVSLPLGKDHLPQDRIQASHTVAAKAQMAQAYVDEAARWLPQTQTESAPGRPVLPLKEKELVLVADDNADMREYLRRLLQDDYRVQMVQDGLEAVEAARQSRPALVLADVMMPGLDGFQLLRALRSDPSLKSLPVILLSARAGEESRVEGLQAGADDYLVKPFTARELLARVATHIKMSRLRGEAAERLHLAQTAARMGTWEWDPARQASVLSPELHRMFDTESSGAHATIWASRVEPADWPMLQEKMSSGYEAGAMEFEYRYRHPEFGLRWFLCKGSRVTGESRMLGVVMDITARKQAELLAAAQYNVTRALAESASLAEAAPQILRAICEVLDWSAGGLWVVDQNSGRLRCLEMFNCEDSLHPFEKACRTLSFTPGEGLPGEVWVKAAPVWVRDVMARANFSRAQFASSAGLHGAFGFPVLSHGQVLGVLEFFSHETRQPDDELLRIMASVGTQIGQYIERVQAEQEQHKLAAIVESSDDAIVSKDLNGIVTSWNASAERMFGYTQQEMLGQSITRIIPPELHDDERHILDTIGRGERIDHFETVRIKKNGERLEVSLTVSPVRDRRGKVVGAAKIARDITQRKRTEQALRTTERLASVGRLAATVAHEINNPLEAVTNLVYLARCSSEGKASEYLARAEEELDRVSHLTKQTLGFYRETRGAIPMRIGASITPLLSVFSPRMRNSGISIQTEIRHDPEIVAVPGEIRQLVANFLSNSIDAMERGGRIRVRLSAATQFAGEGKAGVRLTVADSGSGIPESVQQNLFEPFFTTKKDVGTGLGLWICKSIAEKHGGSIRMKSSVRPGHTWTVFSVFLPLTQEAAVSEQVIRQAV